MVLRRGAINFSMTSTAWRGHIFLLPEKLGISDNPYVSIID
jgi:hypothetical protein